VELNLLPTEKKLYFIIQSASWKLEIIVLTVVDIWIKWYNKISYLLFYYIYRLVGQYPSIMKYKLNVIFYYLFDILLLQYSWIIKFLNQLNILFKMYLFYELSWCLYTLYIRCEYRRKSIYISARQFNNTNFVRHSQN